MKKICVVYRNDNNSEVIEHLESTIKSIIGKYAEVENIYVNRFRDDDMFTADVFLVIDKNLLPSLRKHTASMKKVVIMSRNINKKNLNDLMSIPRDSDVLIVNDTYHNAKQVVYMLYELGIDHLNFVPYDNENHPDDEKYKKYKYALTPNEMDIVPPYIPNVINVGYRKISFDAMVEVVESLEIDEPEINIKLMEYANTIVDAIQNFRIKYFDSFLKGRMLDELIFDSSDAIFVVSNDNRIIFNNKIANQIFGFTNKYREDIEKYLPESLISFIRRKENIKNEIVKIYDTNYAIDKITLNVGGENIGFYVRLQDEFKIKNMDSVLTKGLREKGLIAKYTFNDIKHISSVMNKQVEIAKKIAQTEYTVLITGESGTGKELFAQAIHNQSDRRQMPFVGVNCAAIPESLLESEFFGYEEGAFTGASKHGKIGYFEQANGGTIFLDEIGDMSANLQSRLLRVLQEKQIMRVGSDRVINIDVRIIAATNKNLLQKVKEQSFREDLYYRVNALQLDIPPLRDRKEDVLILFEEFMGKDYMNISGDNRRKLVEYNWPGNIRELENCALYYKTMGFLPIQFDNEGLEEHKLTDKKSDDEEIAIYALSIINKETFESHGIGRTKLLRELESNGFTISDARMRLLLKMLLDKKLITVEAGRKGTQITEEGLRLLSSMNIN